MSESKKDYVPKYIQTAYDYGLMKHGYCLKDYVQEAVVSGSGYEVIAVDGVQRSGKSNMSLQIASWAKEATMRLRRGDKWLSPGWNYAEPVNQDELWEAVLKVVIFKASEFVDYLQNVPDGSPTDVVIWDDVAGHYSNMSFRIDPEVYSQVDGAFTVLGTKAKVIITNIPNLSRLSKNIKDHISMEVFIGRNRKRKLMRVFRLPGLKHIDMNTFKSDIELPSGFDLFKIPKQYWDRYEGHRFELAREVFKKLGENVEMDHPPEGYLSIPDAIRLARSKGLTWGASTVQQGASRGLWGKVRAAGYIFVEESSFTKVMEAEQVKPSN